MAVQKRGANAAKTSGLLHCVRKDGLSSSRLLHSVRKAGLTHKPPSSPLLSVTARSEATWQSRNVGSQSRENFWIASLSSQRRLGLFWIASLYSQGRPGPFWLLHLGRKAGHPYAASHSSPSLRGAKRRGSPEAWCQSQRKLLDCFTPFAKTALILGPTRIGSDRCCPPFTHMTPSFQEAALVPVKILLHYWLRVLSL